MNPQKELVELVAELRSKVASVRRAVRPILSRVEGGEMPTAKGVSYLEVKHHLLLSYCVSMAFYLVMKVGGRSVREHPVLQLLVEIRTTLERLRPLDGKLKYQIDKLLKLQDQAGVDGGAGDDDDPLAYRADPQNMLTKGSDELASSTAGGTELWVPPKLSATPFEEVSLAFLAPLLALLIDCSQYERAAVRRSKEGKKRQKKLAKSELLREIRSEFGEEPEVSVHRLSHQP